MKLTHATVYALHALAYMARQKHDRPASSQHVADEQGVPDRFLLKVLRALVTCDPPVLISGKGPGGGYRLARDASEISLLEIVEAVDGPVRGKAPVPTSSDKDAARRLKHFDRALHAKFEKACMETALIAREHLGQVYLSGFVGKKR